MTTPSTVTELGDSVFYCCSSLVDVRLNEGLEIIGERAFQRCSALRSVTIPSTVTELGEHAFGRCSSLIEVRLSEGLQVIDESAFRSCTALRSVAIPSTVTELGRWAFEGCSSLAEVQFNAGLQTIGDSAFEDCTALRSVTIPATVTTLGDHAFRGCSNLSEVILLGGKRLLNQEFLVCGYQREEQGLLNQEALKEILFYEGNINFPTFDGCPVTTVKISTSWALSERMARLSDECRSFVEKRIRNLCCLDLMQDDNVLACFPAVSRVESYWDLLEVQENLETARNLYQVLQLIAYHELKESSILIELAMWKARIGGAMPVPRADCRVAFLTLPRV